MSSSFRRLAKVCAASLLWVASATVSAPAAPSQGDFDAIARRAFAQNITPGMSVAVVRDGRILFEAAYGFADVAKKTPVTAGTPFAVGSISKQFTAVCVLMLAAQGRLKLDDPLAKYVPNLPNASKITLRQLLWQTTGLHNYADPREHDWPYSGTIDPAKILAILATDKSDFEPGTQWAYSNANYAALARVVQVASGVPYGTYLAKNVFQPFGMSASGYGFAAQQALPVATPYTGAPPFATYPETISLDLFYGAGGVVSSAHDMTLWMDALMSKRLLAPSSLADLWTAGHLTGGSPTTYAMGFVPTTLDGHREVWHNGFSPNAGGYCYDAIFPDDGIGIVILTNEDMKFMGTFPVALTRALFEAVVPPVVQAAAPGENPAITALAKSYWGELAAGKVDLSRLTTQFAAGFTPQFEAQVSAGVASLGAAASWTYLGKSPEASGTTRYEYRLDLATGPKTFVIWLTADGKIAGSQLKL